MSSNKRRWWFGLYTLNEMRHYYDVARSKGDPVMYRARVAIEMMVKHVRGWLFMIGVALAMAGCQEPPPPGGAALYLARTTDAAQVERGGALFAQHCAVCHGNRAQGDANWRQRHPDGTFPPPPLNGSGHAWHHSREWLREVIHSGTEPRGRMPAWGGKLSLQEIDDIIGWFQSLWPDEIYAAWQEMEQRQRAAY